MIVALTVVRLKSWAIPMGFLSMAILRIPLALHSKIRFWKLMGTGRNGTFDKTPDLAQWSMFLTFDTEEDYLAFRNTSWVMTWWKWFSVNEWTLLGTPIAAHGLWDGQNPFAVTSLDPTYTGPISVLTRATIRLSKMSGFWANVPAVASTMTQAPGYVYSIGIGEIPWIKQATFSVWNSVDEVKNFAYRQKEHAHVVKETRRLDWYSEELFARFIPIKTLGNPPFKL